MGALEAISASSESLTTWALAILGASIAAIVSTSYLRPNKERVRLIYLLYLPGWLFIGISMFYGHRIGGRVIAAHINPSLVMNIVEGINHDYLQQQQYLMLGLSLFLVWLVLFLIWWIFGKWTVRG